MAHLEFTITSPVNNAFVGRSVAVSGRVFVGDGGPAASILVDEVRVVLEGGVEQVAQLDQGLWSCTVLALLGWAGGTTRRIRATARATADNAPEPFEVQRTVDVVLDADVPQILTIDSFPSPVTTQPGQPYVLDLSGTVGDAQTGISGVRLRVDTGPFVDVADLVTIGGGLKQWKQTGVEVPAGVHHFTVQALDGAGNLRDATARIAVRLPFEPGAVEQVFQPTRYLLDLRKFAHRYVSVGGTTEALTPAMLAARFHQPFDRLTEPSLFEQATRPLPQARIAVEVVRGRLGAPAPQELDQRFRGLAYQSFLRALGTSYEELRLARTADHSAREALAGRLGIGLVGARPDRLDELTVSPEAITDDELETLCGYRSTAPGDPLRPTTDGAKVLLWRRDALSTQWQREDEAQLDSADGPRPVIDPDLVGESHLRSRQPSDPAFSLWTARQEWITAKLAEIDAAARTGPDPLARFDHVVSTYLGAIDLPGLAEQDAAGANIRPDLVPLDVDLEAFRFLARSRALLDDGVLLDTEWHDVVAILLQVQKRRQYRAWRLEERRASLVLGPASFVLDAAGTTPVQVPRWRLQRSEYLKWRRTLVARTTASAALETSYQRVIDATEATVLPQLRDALIAQVAASAPQEPLEAAAEQLSRELMIDLRADAGQRTTRVDQALETLQGALFSARAGRLDADQSGHDWTIGVEATGERGFDQEWEWMASFRTWLAATQIFAYPENQLLPALYVADPGLQPPTADFRQLIDNLRKESRLTPDTARGHAAAYLAAAHASGVPAEVALTDERSDADLVHHRLLSRTLHQLNLLPQHQREIFWLVPMALAAKLQESGQFQAALDWYQTIYAYHLPPEHRRIYHGLTVEADITSEYSRTDEWLIAELNPHLFAKQRRNCYTRSTIMAIAGCFHAFADAEFARNTSGANARARLLYETAADLLDLPEAQPESGPDVPVPPNPLWESLRQQGRSGLAKIHRGLNIAGVPAPGSGFETTLPSQYRYGVLVERAKNLVAIAQQVEAAYLSALEQRDAKTYDAMRAGHDLQVAGARLALQDLKLADADIGVRLAELQRERAQLQEDHYDQQIREGYSGWEEAGLLALGAAAAFQTAAVAAFGGGAILNSVKSVLSFGLWGDPGNSFGQMLSAAASAASTGGQIAQTIASYERREEEWRLQRGIAGKDVEIGNQQIQLAQNQHQLAVQEKGVAVLQQDHAEAVVVFLATRFTNAELFEWMSGVLARVYAYFLQQATALAQLAEAQLAFERQELPAGFVDADYWRDATAAAAAPDRRGLTGSARLLQDVHRLDQYAFDTDRRKLHLTQTFPLSQIAAFELQQFRQTGVLTFATPQELFDREFPGHYLRLIKGIDVSVIALLPPVYGLRATLSASGVSRVVVARGPFDTVTLRRQPESIALTSPNNATGQFDLEPETGLLMPFEGMGVDTVWQLELPKAANPFDYRTIADVLLTVRYTALDSQEYRQRVVHGLDRRFSGDRSFSIRNQFPDAWYELNNPETIEPERRMRVVLPLSVDDFPPHIHDLRVEHVSLFVVRADELADELTVTSLTHASAGQTVTAAEATTTGGIISTRRPGGAAWGVLLGLQPVGGWELQLVDNELVRSFIRDGLIEDVALVLTLAGTTPAWP